MPVLSFSGRVPEGQSLFFYKSGESWSTMNDLTFVPLFFDPDLTVMFPDATLRQTAQDICSPVRTTKCLFCYHHYTLFHDSST